MSHCHIAWNTRCVFRIRYMSKIRLYIKKKKVNSLKKNPQHCYIKETNKQAYIYKYMYMYTQMPFIFENYHIHISSLHFF